MRHAIIARKFLAAVSFGVLLGTPLLAQADVIALQLPGIPGDAKFAANNSLPVDSIRVLTVGNSVKISTDSLGGGSGVGKPIFSPLSIVKKFGESSGPLFLAVVRGVFLPTATISFYRTKQGLLTRYYTITLQEVSVASQNWVGNSNAVDSADSEELELRYGRITLLDNETGTRSCYDTRTSQTC
ncbi:MAG: type VI secretion system tube protein Hcp [Pseudomonadota bacterium]